MLAPAETLGGLDADRSLLNLIGFENGKDEYLIELIFIGYSKS